HLARAVAGRALLSHREELPARFQPARPLAVRALPRDASGVNAAPGADAARDLAPEVQLCRCPEKSVLEVYIHRIRGVLALNRAHALLAAEDVAEYVREAAAPPEVVF